MSRLIIILLLLSTSGFSQEKSDFLRDFLFEDELKPENNLSTHNKFNFSDLWTTTKNHQVVGIIGSEHQRIKIKLIKVIKSDFNPNIYNVTGKSSVKGNVCEFTGTITLNQIRTFISPHYGVDRIYADSNIRDQGIIIAEYRFDENENQSHSGIFEGILYTKWYLDSNQKIRYDNIQSIADSYMNNAFIGTWTSHQTKVSKLCNWGDYRVPLSNQDFDVGAAEFSPSEKYLDKGWRTYLDAWFYQKESAIKEELSYWWE